MVLIVASKQPDSSGSAAQESSQSVDKIRLEALCKWVMQYYGDPPSLRDEKNEIKVIHSLSIFDIAGVSSTETDDKQVRRALVNLSVEFHPDAWIAPGEDSTPYPDKFEKMFTFLIECRDLAANCSEMKSYQERLAKGKGDTSSSPTGQLIEQTEVSSSSSGGQCKTNPGKAADDPDSRSGTNAQGTSADGRTNTNTPEIIEQILQELLAEIRSQRREDVGAHKEIVQELAREIRSSREEIEKRRAMRDQKREEAKRQRTQDAEAKKAAAEAKKAQEEAKRLEKEGEEQRTRENEARVATEQIDEATKLQQAAEKARRQPQNSPERSSSAGIGLLGKLTVFVGLLAGGGLFLSQAQRSTPSPSATKPAGGATSQKGQGRTTKVYRRETTDSDVKANRPEAAETEAARVPGIQLDSSISTHSLTNQLERQGFTVTWTSAAGRIARFTSRQELSGVISQEGLVTAKVFEDMKSEDSKVVPASIEAVLQWMGHFASNPEDLLKQIPNRVCYIETSDDFLVTLDLSASSQPIVTIDGSEGHDTKANGPRLFLPVVRDK